jgi:rod shape-determining protein MreC
MLSSYSKSHEVFFGGITNQFAGNINKYYNNWAYFFDLKETNAKLVAENAALRNQLAQDFVAIDTSVKAGTLVLRKDSLKWLAILLHFKKIIFGWKGVLSKEFLKIWLPLALMEVSLEW